MCYGVDLGKDQLIDIGEAVGTIARSGTRRTRHSANHENIPLGSIASVGGDITQGLPRVEECSKKKTKKSGSCLLCKRRCELDQ